MSTLLLLAGLLAGDGGDTAKGRLIAVGGGSTIPAITQKALDLAGGGTARLLIVPQASARPEAGEESASFWREAGAKNVQVLDLTDPKKAVQAVNQADLIWMPGGDQNRLMKALAGTGVPEALRERWKQGATVGGTSAGAAALSKLMLTGEGGNDALHAGGVGLADGLGLWTDGLVDQHFVRRGRVNRLLSAVLDHPELVGVGIDESTAVIVAGRELEVIGKSSVVVIDARKATAGKADKGQPQSAVNVTVHVLKVGMKYHLDRGVLTP